MNQQLPSELLFPVFDDAIKIGHRLNHLLPVYIHRIAYSCNELLLGGILNLKFVFLGRQQLILFLETCILLLPILLDLNRSRLPLLIFGRRAIPLPLLVAAVLHHVFDALGNRCNAKIFLQTVSWLSLPEFRQYLSGAFLPSGRPPRFCKDFEHAL